MDRYFTSQLLASFEHRIDFSPEVIGGDFRKMLDHHEHGLDLGSERIDGDDLKEIV